MDSTDLILGPLNPPQREAVLATSGPVLILAGAGSGKTRALTHRIAYLIHNGVPPWQILSVTFTNRAAKEMKERIKAMLHLTGDETLDPTKSHENKLPIMGTFHSICVRILRRDIEHLGRDRNFGIYDDDDQEKLIKTLLKKMNIDEKELKPRAALGYIGRFKSEAVSPKEAMEDATTPRLQSIVTLYAEYQKELAAANALDFDDLILETVRLFHECPDVLNRYQETWKYLHVDEYQDTNHAQYLFITMLAQKYRNLCVIGDPDQSIYAFRGADIRNILEFEKEYTDAKRIKLEQNYRSTQPVLTAADKVIAANPNRPQKTMWTERTEGPKVIVHEVSDERREAEEAIKMVEDMNRRGTALNEQVILYRTHAQSRLFEEACMRRGVAYRILGGVKFYARREVKDVLAYLHAILNPQDTVSVLRIINVPSRKIGQTTLGRIQTFSQTEGVSLWECLLRIDEIPDLDMPVRERIRRFTDLIERLARRSEEAVVSRLTADLLDEVDMSAWIKDGTEEGDERWLNVQELLSVMQKYDHLDPRTSLTSFLEEAALVSEVDKLAETRGDALTMMTLHLCKGLEFEHVIIAGCEEGIFPHSSSLFDREQLEEERRLLYVGMTRARTQLRIFFAQSRLLWGERRANAKSRFLDDLPDEVTERRSDDVLSAFAWTAAKAMTPMSASRPGQPLQPYRQNDVSIEFNQDLGGDDDMNQDGLTHSEMVAGLRVAHPVFGAGTILDRRGDIVDIRFDNGKTKTLALSIAPLKAL